MIADFRSSRVMASTEALILFKKKSGLKIQRRMSAMFINLRQLSTLSKAKKFITHQQNSNASLIKTRKINRKTTLIQEKIKFYFPPKALNGRQPNATINLKLIDYLNSQVAMSLPKRVFMMIRKKHSNQMRSTHFSTNLSHLTEKLQGERQ